MPNNSRPDRPSREVGISIGSYWPVDGCKLYMVAVQPPLRLLWGILKKGKNGPKSREKKQNFDGVIFL